MDLYELSPQDDGGVVLDLTPESISELTGLSLNGLSGLFGAGVVGKVSALRDEDLAEVYAMAKIANSPEYTYEACDHLADKGIEFLANGKWTWTSDGWTVAHLVHEHFDGGAIGFFDLMDEYAA